MFNDSSAGITDSALTNHGVLQTNRLGQYLADTGVKVSYIFSSDLVRAFKTAEAIRQAQPREPNGLSEVREVIKLTMLREQDFGSYEGKTFYERSRDLNKNSKDLYYEASSDKIGFRDAESKEAMRRRADTFVEQHLLSLFETLVDDESVVVVAHGIILSHLWRSVMRCFPSALVTVAPGATTMDRPMDLMHLGTWSNTGYLELEWKKLDPFTPECGPESASQVKSLSVDTRLSPKALGVSLVVKAVNSLEHLKGVKKTRGGIGSSKHDEGQKTIESFFKKRKIG